MTSNQVSWTFRTNAVSILVIRLAILLSVRVCLEAASRTVAVDPEGRAIEQLAAAMHDPDQRDESRAALKSFIEDRVRKPGIESRRFVHLGAKPQGVNAAAELVRTGWNFERLAAAGLSMQFMIYANETPGWVMTTSESTPPK